MFKISKKLSMLLFVLSTSCLFSNTIHEFKNSTSTKHEFNYLNKTIGNEHEFVYPNFSNKDEGRIHVFGKLEKPDTEITTSINTPVLKIKENPCIDKIVDFQVNLKERSTISLYTLDGRLIQTMEAEGCKDLSIDMKGSVSGVYLLTLTSIGYNQAIKIVIL